MIPQEYLNARTDRHVSAHDDAFRESAGNCARSVTERTDLNSVVSFQEQSQRTRIEFAALKAQQGRNAQASEVPSPARDEQQPRKSGVAKIVCQV